MKAQILIIDDTPENVQLLVGILTAEGYKVRAFAEEEFALQAAYNAPPDLILLDIRMPNMDGYEVCRRLKADERTRDVPIIFLSALGEVTDKFKGFRAGGVDYVTKPFHPEEVLMRVETHVNLYRLRHRLETLVEQRTVELRQALNENQRLQEKIQAENVYLREEIRLEHNFEHILGQSRLLKELLFRVEQVAPTDTTALITGETGTGKELVARALHAASRRANQPLVKLNCAALPAHLIESELFGHEKGAFTGAAATRIGRFELADGGTLFLDEIGELPLQLQPKLLRVLQDGEFERLGSSRTRKVNVRVLAATNRDLNAEIETGRFRKDLYYRLSVFPLPMPPLRERREDIPLLTRAFVKRFNKQLGKQIDVIPSAAMYALQQRDWPGNIRELKNEIERAVILSPEQTLQIDEPGAAFPPRDSIKTLEEIEREHILLALQATDGIVHGPEGAAALLGLNPSTLRGRMRKFKIQKKKSS